ncbi:Transcription factor GRAS, partial [Corchorus capsularis]
MESHPLWPIYNPLEDSTLDEIGLYFAEMDTQLSSFDQFSNSSVSIEDFSDISSSTLHPFLGNHFPGILPSLGCGESPSSDQFMLDGSENFPELITYERSNSSQQIFSEDFSISSSSQNLSPISGEVSVEIPSIQAPLVLPSENMEVDEQLVIPHLLKAYGEAMESQQIELADEIVSCLKDKASPTGKTLERLLFYLTFALDKQGNYLRQESIKNYEAAFEAFYQIFPYSRFAHFGANSAILEAIPIDAKEWEESTRKSDFLSELGLAPRRMSRENYEEAKELVREGKSSYW